MNKRWSEQVAHRERTTNGNVLNAHWLTKASADAIKIHVNEQKPQAANQTRNSLRQNTFKIYKRKLQKWIASFLEIAPRSKQTANREEDEVEKG